MNQCTFISDVHRLRCGLAAEHTSPHAYRSRGENPCTAGLHSGEESWTCVLTADHEGSHLDTDEGTWKTPGEPVGTCTAVLNMGGVHPYQSYSCVLDAGHDGFHQDSDTDRWDITGLVDRAHALWPSTPPCGALYAPSSMESYECTRLRNHGGMHLDDSLNTLWRSGWDPADLHMEVLDASHRAAPVSLPSDTDPDQWQELYKASGYNRDQMYMTLVQRIGSLEARLKELDIRLDRIVLWEAEEHGALSKRVDRVQARYLNKEFQDGVRGSAPRTECGDVFQGETNTPCILKPGHGVYHMNHNGAEWD